MKLNSPRNFPQSSPYSFIWAKLSGLFNLQSLGKNPIKTEYLIGNSKLEADINRINYESKGKKNPGKEKNNSQFEVLEKPKLNPATV